MKINQLTSSEEILMQILWKLNSAYMKNILENYPEPKPHQNTVSTFMKILVEKEFLTTKKEGRIFKYSVAVPFEDYRNFLLKNLLKNYFDNSGSKMLQALVDEKLLSSEETQKPDKKSNHSDKANPISDFVEEITSEKKKKRRDKKKKDKKK